MPPFKDWELRNRPPMWQPPPEDEPLMSIKGLYQDNARLIIHTYLFASHRNKLAYIPVIYMCICVHVFGLSITIDYTFPGWLGFSGFLTVFPAIAGIRAQV